MNLTTQQRESILTRIQALVSDKYFDPAFDDAAWHRVVAKYRNIIVEAKNNSDFEEAISKMLGNLSHRALSLLSPHTPISPRNIINASFSIVEVQDKLRWVVEDVLPGGIAARAGLGPGDVLLTISGEPALASSESSPEPPLGSDMVISLNVLRGVPSREISVTLDRTPPMYKEPSKAKASGLTVGSQTGEIAYLRVSHFPGRVGIDFANETDAIFRGRFASNDRLIIDLRGNPGGGIGGLALMSYLTPEQRPVGYSWGRKMAREHGDPSKLPVFRKIPRSRFAIPFLAIKYGRELSVYVHTEAPGRRAFRGRTVILVNRHTGGAAEMFAQFAQENRLATIVGCKTMGRLISRQAGKLGFGYRLALPVAAYISAKGTQIDGKGITPDIDVPWSFNDAIANRDNQLAAAIEVFHSAKTT